MSRFTILMYHMIREPGNAKEARYACPPPQFKQHMQLLREENFTPISLSQAGAAITSGKAVPDNAVVVTLDDGFMDNYEFAFPIFQQSSIPATIFLTTGHLARYNQWMRSKDYPERPMMNWNQIREMDNHGIDFGAHTVSHPRLTELDYSQAKIEIKNSKNDIEDNLSKPCPHFAYPYGLFRNETKKIVEETGFSLACSTRSGFNNESRDPFILHRIEVYGADSVWKLKQKMTYGMNDASLFFPLTYYSRRIAARFQ